MAKNSLEQTRKHSLVAPDASELEPMAKFKQTSTFASPSLGSFGRPAGTGAKPNTATAYQPYRSSFSASQLEAGRSHIRPTICVASPVRAAAGAPATAQPFRPIQQCSPNGTGAPGQQADPQLACSDANNNIDGNDNNHNNNNNNLLRIRRSTSLSYTSTLLRRRAQSPLAGDQLDELTSPKPRVVLPNFSISPYQSSTARRPSWREHAEQ